MKIPQRILSLIAIIAMFSGSANAVNEKKSGWPWNLKLHGYHDAEVAEALGTGWFLNVGPTGIRIRIPKDQPQYMQVKYVFKKSPASGIVNIDDMIVGANGTRLTVAHQFGRGKGRLGWEGPMMDMSKLIEDSQGKDGKLELIIWPGGDKSQEKTVTVQIEPVGRFSDTYPYNCPRSDKLMIDLCDFLVSEYKRAGKFESRDHTNAACLLALMASGDDKYQSLIDDIMKGYRDKQYDATKGVGFPVWGQVHDAIVMGEYYLLEHDKRLEPAMKSLADCLNDSVWPTTGGLSHRPFAFIQRRMASGGPKGYGAMALPAGLGMLGLSLFKEAGLPHAEASYQRFHEGFLSSVDPNGAIGYGFKSWDHAVIELTDPKANPKPSPLGIGFECLEGLKDVGEYKTIWPTKADPRYRPTDWLTKEADTNRVFTKGGNQRLVIRNMTPDEPTKAYNQAGGACDHFARSGTGALAHKIGNSDNESWGYLGDFMATGCAKSFKGLMDGHASTHMHVLWGSLGAAAADPKDFREYMDYIKWWMIMAQTHDGSYVVMPGRDYASTDHVYGTRNFPTACAALILSVKEKRLRITGADISGGGSSSSRVSRLPSDPAVRPAREIPAETKAIFDELLLTALGKLEKANQIEPVPMSMSKAQTKVWFAGFDPDMKLIYRAMQGESKASFLYSDLTELDHAMLAALAARFKPDDLEAQAMAGVFMEVAGNSPMADAYYEKAGATQAENIKTIFK